MKSRRLSLMIYVLLGVALLTASGLAAGWLLRLDGSWSGEDGAGAGPGSRAALEKVVLSGHVDLRKGLARLYPLQPGRVTEVMVKEGERVKKGEGLLRVSDQQAKALVEQARADLQARQADLTEARKAPRRQELAISQIQEGLDAMSHQIAAAQQTLSHAQELYKLEVMGEDEVVIAKNKVEALKAERRAQEDRLKEGQLVEPETVIEKAAAAVKASQAQLEAAENGLEERVLRAPEDGEVLRVTTRAGDVLGPDPVGPAILFAPDDERIVRLHVEQELASQIQEGDRAQIQDDIDPGRSRAGKVVYCAGIFLEERTALPSALAGTAAPRTLECIVSLAPGEPLFRIGQRVRVTILKSSSGSETGKES